MKERFTGSPDAVTAWTNSAAGRACSPTRDAIVTSRVLTTTPSFANGPILGVPPLSKIPRRGSLAHTCGASLVLNGVPRE